MLEEVIGPKQRHLQIYPEILTYVITIHFVDDITAYLLRVEWLFKIYNTIQ